MSRLYLRFYFALLGSLILAAAVSAVVLHRIRLLLAQDHVMLGHHVRAIHAIVFVLISLSLTVGIGALPIVRRLTQRLERLQVGVESLGAGDLSARVAVEGRDEVARLAISFNRAADRIEALVAAHKALLANASHELRTPLARIRMTVELMKESADPRRKADLEQDIGELDALIDELLLSSRLDAVSKLDTNEDVDLLALMAEECARYEQVELLGDAVSLRYDPRLLRRMLRNLLENAQRHGRPPVQVRLSAEAGIARISVADEGAAIPQDQRECLFEPFYRYPSAHADAQDNRGVGLGLALVRQIAQRHGGEALCVSTVSGRNCFVVNLPIKS